MTPIAKMIQLRDQIIADIEDEEQHLKDIGGPTGTRNSQASALGLARNSMRAEFITALDQIIDEGEEHEEVGGREVG